MSCKRDSAHSVIPQSTRSVNSKNRNEEVKPAKQTFFLNSKGARIDKVEKSMDDWAKQLSKMEFYVLREKGTEPSFTGDLLRNNKKGVYTCAACALPLFESKAKFKSGTGWPSFYQPIDQTHILEEQEPNLTYIPTEVMCNRCEGHLGHVFTDGRQPTGLRYCINSVSLNFEEAN